MSGILLDSPVRIRNWSQLNEELFRDAWYSPHGRFRGPYVFRGATNAAWGLDTSLMRLGGPYSSLEKSLLRNFRKYAHRDAAPGDSFWHWLALAQHHGLPTRLLDWTFSPHVAAHFATDDVNDYPVDGAVWAVDFIRIHEMLPKALKKVLKSNDSFVFTTTMLDGFAPSLDEFDRLLAKGSATVTLFLEPPSLDARIVNQAAFLSVTSPATARLDHWLENCRPHLCRKIIIPASVKPEIRDKLDMMNLTERMIYPGLDGLCKWLKRYYSPLNLLEVTYSTEETRVGVIERSEDGTLTARLFDNSGETGLASLRSEPGGKWIDVDRGCAVTVKPRPAAAKCAAALAYLRKTPPARTKQ